jgi:hypothetical protein
MMKAQLLNLLHHNEGPGLQLNSSLSLKPFLRFLEATIGTREGARTQQLRYVVDRIKELPDWDKHIPLDRIEAFKEAFELIYITLSAPITDEDENIWALTMPFTPEIFSGTNALYRFMQDESGTVKERLIHDVDLAEKELSRLSIIYGFILDKFYGLSLSAQSGMVHHVKDEKTGLNKYYKVEFDSRFVDVEYDGKLPDINFENVRLIEDSKFEALSIIQKALPLSKFHFTGFSMISMHDITAQQVMENIKDIIVNLSPGQPVYQNISNALKEIMGNNFLDVTLMPVLKLNGKLVTNCFKDHSNELVETCAKYNLPMQMYISTLEKYMKDPQVIFRKNIAEVLEGEEKIFPILRGMGVEGIVILPIFFQKQLVGILNIFSKQKNGLTESMLSAIEPAIPLLEQLLQTTIDDFKITLDNTVKEKFTSLQPAVEWRFNEVAFEYLQKKKMDKRAEIDEVYFSDVHPLYGAIDIRNSTLERNNALRADMQQQLNLLTRVLEQLKSQREMGLTSELIFKTKQWLEEISDFITSDNEFQMNQFFELEVTPFLLHFRQSFPKTAEIIDDYFIAIGPSGIAHTNRRELEDSLQLLNRTVSNLLDQMNMEIQDAYPYYFEKYRSDGIEYDIYIGQSLTPDREFHLLYLKNLRLWQLNSMALIAKLTQAMQPQLSKKLQTTQLIFVHSNTIDISFRNDEHRFDVEGAYNIRYEMIKKRIDKVLIKNTNERLTQPGKIALVYFQQKDIEEYMSHIRFLQDQNILEDEVEFLELEELQGVSGLKALRVGVILDMEEHAGLDTDEKLQEFIQ